MNLEDWSFNVVCGLLIGLVVCLPIGAYKYGRYLERRLLTEALTNSLEKMYYQGREDGVNEGYQRGLKEFDSLADTDGHR